MWIRWPDPVCCWSCVILSMNTNIGYVSESEKSGCRCSFCCALDLAGQRGRLHIRICDKIALYVYSIHGNGAIWWWSCSSSGISLLWVSQPETTGLWYWHPLTPSYLRLPWQVCFVGNGEAVLFLYYLQLQMHILSSYAYTAERRRPAHKERAAP